MLKRNLLAKLKLIFCLLFIFTFQNRCFSQVSIQMKRQGGVSVIPCRLNGLTLDFIFDSGASDVTISLTEATFMLKNGYLSYNDIVGSERYRTASGEISEGIKIILREIEFGGLKLRNVEASIIKTSNAPLLLGQSALSKLGDITVNFETNILTIKSPKSSSPNISKYLFNDHSELSNNQILKVYRSNPLFHKTCSKDFLSNTILELLQNNIRPRENESDFIFSFKNNYLIMSQRYGNFNKTFVNISEGINVKNLAVSRIQSIGYGVIFVELNVYGNNSMKNYTYEDYGKKLIGNGLLVKEQCDNCSDKTEYTGIRIELREDSWNNDLSKIFSNCMYELSKRLGNRLIIKTIILK